MRNWKLPVFATLAYLLAGSLWILAGHFLSGTFYPSDGASLFELVKGLVFVGITATVLFIALTYLDQRNADNMIAGDLGAEFNRSLRHGDFVARWLPALVVVVYLAIFMIIAAALWWVREHTLNGGEKSALALQKAQAAQMSSSLDIINFTLRDIAHDVANSRQQLPAEKLRGYIPDVASSVANIGYTDASGKVIAHTNTAAVNLDFASRSYFKFHRDNPDSGFHLSEPFIGTAVVRALIIASRPIHTPSGKFSGVVTAVIDPAIFGAYWRQSSDSDTTISVYDSNDKLLLRSPYRETAIGHADWQPLSALSEVKEGNSKAFRATSPVDGVDRVYGAGAIPGYPKLRLIVGLNQSQLLESWLAFAVTSLSLYLLVASGLTALTFALLRQLRERLVLQRKAAELARYPLQNRNPVLTVTPAGKKLFMNKAARQLIEAIKGPAVERLEQQLRTMAAETAPGLTEFALGTHIWSASYVPHAPDFCDIYMTDVTATRQGEHLLQLFFDLPFIGMAITSPESKRWLRFNNQLCEILGYTRKQLEEKTWAELIHPDDLATDVAEFERLLRDESDGYSLDKRLVRADGAVIDTVVDIHAVRRPDRSVEFCVATIQDITERKQAERRLLEQRNLYAALTATNEAIIRIRDRKDLLQQVCEIAVERTGIVFAWVGMLNDAEKLRPVARAGEDQGILELAMTDLNSADRSECVAASRALAHNRIEVVNNWKDDPGLAPWLELFGKAGFQSLAVLPIRENGTPIATLHLYADEPGYFRPDIVSLLNEMGADLDYALEGLRAQAERDHATIELQRAEERWQFALEGGDHGVWEWNIPAGSVFYSPRWKTMLGYQAEEISDSPDEYKSRVHPDDWQKVETGIQGNFEGITPIYSCEHRVRCKDGSYKWVLGQGKVFTRDATGAPLKMIGTNTDISAQKQADIALAESEQKFKALVEQSLIGIYMVDEDKLIYVNPRAAEIFGYEPEELSEVSLASVIAPEDRALVRNNIHQRTAGGIETMRYEFRGLRKDGQRIDVGVHGSRTMLGNRPVVLGVLQDITDRRIQEDRVKEYLHRLERSIMSTVQAISHMVDLRDPYTSGHERRVGELAAAIGTELGLTEHQVTGLRVAGGVHDVGKIAVPAEILSKPTRLSSAEFAIVKTHAQQGYEILKDIDFPWPVAETVWQHHERLDGSGYPRGLRGDEISLEARIMAVADVVESMSTHRPYRPALGVEAAVAELESKAGSLYDPVVVAACVRLFHQKGYQLPE
jgi:PAS domain S-box-containing protein